MRWRGRVVYHTYVVSGGFFPTMELQYLFPVQDAVVFHILIRYVMRVSIRPVHDILIQVSVTLELLCLLHARV